MYCRTYLVPGVFWYVTDFWGVMEREREQMYIWLQYKALFFLDRKLNLQMHKTTDLDISVTLESLAMMREQCDQIRVILTPFWRITDFPWLELYHFGDPALIPHSYLLGWKVYGEWSLDVSTATCCCPLASSTGTAAVCTCVYWGR